jgi:multicomponent K+:H+ antiporter subunit D
MVSLAVGAVGVLGAKKLDRLVAFAVISSMGMVMVAVGMFTEESIASALYYMIHSTLAAGALFLIVDLVRQSRGHLNLVTDAPVTSAALVSGMFMVAAIAIAGLPPLSGFVGKLMVLNAAFDDGLAVWVWSFVLVSSLITIVGFARAGSVLFWKAQADSAPVAEPGRPVPSPLSFVAVGGLLALLTAHTLFAGRIYDYTTVTAAQLFTPDTYISTVLETPGKLDGAKAGDY